MHRKSLRTVLFAALACLMPLVASAQKVDVDYDKAVDFSKARTYSWQPGQPVANPLIHKRIISAIDRQLAAKGWTKVESSPNAVLVYQAAVDEQRELTAWGSGPRWSGFGTARVEKILVGQLVVDIYDASSEQLMWRGFVSDTVTDSTEKNDRKLNDAVAKLFKRFPPKGETSSDR
jgi:hypothetical protein